jgi:predicted Zn-dependent protease
LKLYFSPVQQIADTLEVKQGDRVVYSKKISLSPLQLFADSLKANAGDVLVTLGSNKLIYNSKPDADNLSRPLDLPKDFDWNSAYGLYTQGKEFMDQKMYPEAEEKLQASLKRDPYFLPALVQLAALMYHDLRYAEALSFAKTALSINTNDGATNYYYGIINAQMGNVVDAKDGFDIAGLSVEYRNAAYSALSSVYLEEKNYAKALEFASKALDFNRLDISSLQIQATAYRYLNDGKNAARILDTILAYEPLNHFARFEQYLNQPSEAGKTAFTAMIRNEQPIESYLDLADWYYKNGCLSESEEVLQMSPSNALVNYKLAFLQHKAGKPFNELLSKANTATAAFVFPFRNSDEEVLRWAMQQSNNWKPKYFLALLYKDRNRIDESKKLFADCGTQPDFAPFYAARAVMSDNGLVDLSTAVKLDKGWRYNKLLGEYYVNHKQYAKALTTVEPFYKSHPDNYIIGMLYAKTLLLNKRYSECGKLLSRIDILPFEGATIGRELYRETELMQAVEKLKAKNYQAALNYITDAKKWPANLGVGKPYPENIDERLENWMSYLCYTKIGKADEATRYLHKITAFKPQIDNTVSNFLSANHLVTAWAIEKLDGREKASAWLANQIAQYPDDKILQWCKEVFDSGKFQQSNTSDSGIRIIEQLM